MSLPKRIHFIGIGGIGMSGLARMFLRAGCAVSGSDRALGRPEKEQLFQSLRAAGASLFPQDGSAFDAGQPDALVYSTAIESDNPDLLRAAPTVRRLHRSQALAIALDSLDGRVRTIAVTGTCGKTSVSAWLADALYELGENPGMLCGGFVKKFRTGRNAGNWRDGNGAEFVLEADESDKSLLNYAPEIALILNIGTDHFSREELADAFRAFANSARFGAVLSWEAYREIGPDTLSVPRLELFSVDPNAPDEENGRPVLKLKTYRIEHGRARCVFGSLPELRLPAPGLHNAANALAVLSALRLLGIPSKRALPAVEAFQGVARRFDVAGRLPCGAVVVDDYAHNVEKILSCLEAAHELADETGGRIFAVFQPHGFAPLRFMRDKLFDALERSLRNGDRFAMLPVYYAGGTAAFSPTSDEVVESWKRKTSNPDRYRVFPGRAACEEWLKSDARSGDFVLIMGARDDSLSIWAKKIANET